MKNIYDHAPFFDAYANMERSKGGLEAAGEWHQLQLLFPNLQGKMLNRALEENCDEKIISECK